jgi:Caspase domain
MGVRAVEPGRSRIVLVGAPVYDDPRLPDVPQVERNLVDLAAVFTDPGLGGFAAEHCEVVGLDASVDQVGDALATAATQAEDLLLFYFAGHGLIGPRGELYLCLRSTRFGHPAYSALRFETVRDTFLELGSRARNRVVILDSCFSGRAIGTNLAGPAMDTLADELEINGTYTLTSAPPNGVAMVRASEAHTAFTGRLISLLREGDERAGELLSLGEIYRRLQVRLHSDGLPLPQQRGTATADLLGLVRNARPARPDPAPLTAEMLALLSSTSVRGRLAGVAEVGDWLEDPDPSRAQAARLALTATAEGNDPDVAAAARQLLDSVSATVDAAPAAPSHVRAAGTHEQASRDARAATAGAVPVGMTQAARRARIKVVLDQAEHMVKTINDRKTLIEITTALAAIDPDRAERIAGATSTRYRRDVLAKVATTLAVIDPERAERIAGALGAYHVKEQALAEIASALVATDPDRAERIAATITALWHAKARVLAELATALAGTDLDRAEDLANAIPDGETRVKRYEALIEVAKVAAVTDPDHAHRILTPLPTEYRNLAWAEIAASLAAVEPDRAEDIVSTVSDDEIAQRAKQKAQAEIAKAFAATDPDRAEVFAMTIVTGTDAKAQALAATATALAGTDPDRAERIADTIVGESVRVKALAEICIVFAAVDPDRAERTAGTIANVYSAVPVLAEFARTLAATDPDRAERIAGTISRDLSRAQVLAAIAAELALTDPDRAERIAGSIGNAEHRGRVLTEIARTLTTIDSKRAERIAATIPDAVQKVAALAAVNPDRAERVANAAAHHAKDGALATVAEALAATDPARAERIAEAITNLSRKSAALAQLCVVVAATDPARAERIAGTIPHAIEKVRALIEVARGWSTAAACHPRISHPTGNGEPAAAHGD